MEDICRLLAFSPLSGRAHTTMLVLYMGATMVAVFVLTAVLGGDSGAGLSAEFPWQFRLVCQSHGFSLVFTCHMDGLYECLLCI